VGRVSNNEKYKILSESYAYIQLSRFEGFGLSIVEALSLGKPVIISPKVPISNVIKRNKAGYVAANANQACIALQEVFRLDNEGYTTIGNNALKCYQKNYTPEMITKQMIEMYEESVYGGIVNEEIIL
jgi:glycosyltransferase involved in cell wall biosynthesis